MIDTQSNTNPPLLQKLGSLFQKNVVKPLQTAVGMNYQQNEAPKLADTELQGHFNKMAQEDAIHKAHQQEQSEQKISQPQSNQTVASKDTPKTEAASEAPLESEVHIEKKSTLEQMMDFWNKTRALPTQAILPQEQQPLQQQQPIQQQQVQQQQYPYPQMQQPFQHSYQRYMPSSVNFLNSGNQQGMYGANMNAPAVSNVGDFAGGNSLVLPNYLSVMGNNSFLSSNVNITGFYNIDNFGCNNISNIGGLGLDGGVGCGVGGGLGASGIGNLGMSGLGGLGGGSLGGLGLGLGGGFGGFPLFIPPVYF